MDELRKPLKPQGRLKRWLSKRPTPAQAAWVAAVGLVCGFVAWGWLMPPADESLTLARAKVERVDPLQTGSTDQADPGAVITRTRVRKDGARIITIERSGDESGSEFELVPDDPGVGIDAESLPSRPDERADGGEGRRKVAALGGVRHGRISLPPAPQRELIERTAFGLLPRIHKGRKPWRAYARPVPASVLHSKKPKIALVIGGLGLNPKRTEEAIRVLPEEVTLAFAPLASALQRDINRARRAGHEVMLQVPMEPWGYPAVNPGPQTLLVSASVADTLGKLKRLMGKAGGYIGVVNYTGQKFLASESALQPVLRELKRRGLVFLDDGITERSKSLDLARRLGVPALRADLRIDVERSEGAIRAALAQLEALAQMRGHAIGIGSAFKETLEAVDAWNDERIAKGEILLVPLSALYRLKGR